MPDSVRGSSVAATWQIVRPPRTFGWMVAAVAAAATLACLPAPGLGRAFYRRGVVSRMVDLATCGDRAEAGAPSLYVPRPSTSPDGRYVVELREVRNTNTGTSSIVVHDRRTHRIHVAFRLRESYRRAPAGMPGPLVFFRWSGDGKWLFFAIDPQGSASLAADGLDMRVVSAAGGHVNDLGVRLAYADYLAWCGGRLVYTGGGDRVATTAKSLLAAAPPDWKPRELVRDPARTWGSLACASDGRSVVVQSQPVSNDANFFHTHWSLWRVGLDGAHARLTSPPPGFADEAPRQHGNTLFFVRSRKGRGSLYALQSGRLLGPFASLGYSLGYYGHNDWFYAITR